MIDRITDAEMEQIREAVETLLEGTWELNTKKEFYDLKRAFDEGFGNLNGFTRALGLVYTRDITDRVFDEIIENVWRDYTKRYYDELLKGEAKDLYND